MIQSKAKTLNTAMSLPTTTSVGVNFERAGGLGISDVGSGGGTTGLEEVSEADAPSRRGGRDLAVAVREVVVTWENGIHDEVPAFWTLTDGG